MIIPFGVHPPLPEPAPELDLKPDPKDWIVIDGLNRIIERAGSGDCLAQWILEALDNGGQPLRPPPARLLLPRPPLDGYPPPIP